MDPHGGYLTFHRARWHYKARLKCIRSLPGHLSENIETQFLQDPDMDETLLTSDSHK